jgi:hypothetical protein
MLNASTQPNPQKFHCPAVVHRRCRHCRHPLGPVQRHPDAAGCVSPLCAAPGGHSGGSRRLSPGRSGNPDHRAHRKCGERSAGSHHRAILLQSGAVYGQRGVRPEHRHLPGAAGGDRATAAGHYPTAGQRPHAGDLAPGVAPGHRPAICLYRRWPGTHGPDGPAPPGGGHPQEPDSLGARCLPGDHLRGGRTAGAGAGGSRAAAGAEPVPQRGHGGSGGEPTPARRGAF